MSAAGKWECHPGMWWREAETLWLVTIPWGGTLYCGPDEATARDLSDFYYNRFHIHPLIKSESMPHADQRREYESGFPPL